MGFLEMTKESDCKNCLHTKHDHKLVLGRHGDGDFLPGTSMPSGKLDSKIICTKCLNFGILQIISNIGQYG